MSKVFLNGVNVLKGAGYEDCLDVVEFISSHLDVDGGQDDVGDWHLYSERDEAADATMLAHQIIDANKSRAR